MKGYLLITGLVFMSTYTFAAETFTANELCKTFHDDGAAAENKYKNKRIIVSGRIAKISDGYKYWHLRLSCNRRTSGMIGVPMKVNKSESNQLKILAKADKDFPRVNYDWENKYDKGRNIKFSCKYKRRNKIGVYLKDCHIY